MWGSSENTKDYVSPQYLERSSKVSFSIKLAHYDTFWPVEAQSLEARAAFPHFVLRICMRWRCPCLAHIQVSSWLVLMLCRWRLHSPLPALHLGQLRAHISAQRSALLELSPEVCSWTWWGQEQKIQHSPLPWLYCCPPALPDALTVLSPLFSGLIHGSPLSSPESHPIKSQGSDGPEMLNSLLLKAFFLMDTVMSLP